MRQLPLPQDLEWLESLFKLYSKRVRAFAIRRVGPDAADDVVSEVFGIAWKRRRNVPEPALPWLLRTAHHVVSHERRGLSRRLNLSELSSTDAEILRLTAWEGLTPREIAVVLDLSDAAARTRLKRARQRAQQLLNDSAPAPRLAVVTPHLQGEPS